MIFFYVRLVNIRSGKCPDYSYQVSQLFSGLAYLLLQGN